MSYLRTCKRGRARCGPTLLRRLLLYCEGGSKSPLLQALLVRVLKFQFLTAHRNVAGVKDAWVSFFHVHQVQYHLGSIRPCLGKPRHWNPIGHRSFALDPISSQGCGGLALDPSPSEGCRGFALDQRLCFGSNSVSMRPSLISCTFGPTILRRRLFYERGSKSPLLEALVKLRVLKLPAVHHNVAGVKEAWVSFFHVQQVRYHLEVFDRSISRLPRV